MKLKGFAALCAAGTVLAGMFAGCSEGRGWITTDDPSKRAELVMWVPTAGGLEPSDNDKVMAKVNEYLATVLPNTALTLKYEDSNNFSAVMTRMLSAEEPFDICFTSYSTNSYFDNAKDESFYPFSREQLVEYAPAVWESVDEDIWEMIRVNDRYCALVNNQIRARQAGVSLDTTMLRKYIAAKTSADSYTAVSDSDIQAFVGENFKEFASMEDFLAFAKSENGGRYRFTATMPDMEAIMYCIGLDDFGNYRVPGSIPVDAVSAEEIVNQFETDAFKDFLKIFKSWYGKYVDTSVMSGGITSSVYSTVAMRYLGTYKPGVEQEEYVICSKDMTGIGFGDAIVTSTSSLTTMSAVSYTSKNPIRALKLLNLLYTDKTLYNLLVYGREGTDYLVKESADGVPTQIEVFSSAKYKINNSWAYGNQYLAYPTTRQSADVWQQSEKFSNEAKKSVAYGFIFDETPVTAEIANCANVYGNYFMQLLNNTDPYTDSGADTDKRFYEDFIAAQKKAGSDKIISELKKQFAEFLAAKEE